MAIWPRCAASRKTAVDRMGFILWQSWAALDRGLPLQRRAGQSGRPATFPTRRWSGEPRCIAQLRRLWESRFDRVKALSLSKGIELEIIHVLEAGHALRESPDYELHRLTTQTTASAKMDARNTSLETLEGAMRMLVRILEELLAQLEKLRPWQTVELMVQAAYQTSRSLPNESVFAMLPTIAERTRSVKAAAKRAGDAALVSKWLHAGRQRLGPRCAEAGDEWQPALVENPLHFGIGLFSGAPKRDSSPGRFPLACGGWRGFSQRG